MDRNPGECFGDGIVEDIITELSRLSGLRRSREVKVEN